MDRMIEEMERQKMQKNEEAGRDSLVNDSGMLPGIQNKNVQYKFMQFSVNNYKTQSNLPKQSLVQSNKIMYDKFIGLKTKIKVLHLIILQHQILISIHNYFNMDNQYKQPFSHWQISHNDYRPQEDQPDQNMLREPQTNKNDQGKTGHWSQKENAKYYAFLRKFQEKFSERQLRRQCKVFKALSKFIRTRNPNQCRSHHHKMTKNFSTIQQALENLRHKSSSLQEKTDKYFQSLKSIQFSSIEDEQQPWEVESSQRRKNQARLQESNLLEKRGEKIIQSYDINKNNAQDIANMKTGTVVEPVDNYDHLVPYGMASPQFQNFGAQMLGNNMNYYYNPYSQMSYPEHRLLPLEEVKTRVVLQAHELFLKWQQKMREYNELSGI